MEDLIKMGDYVIVQRQEYYKLEKMEKKTVTRIGNRIVDLSAILDKPYFTTFKVITNLVSDGRKGAAFALEETKDIKTVEKLSIEKSGFDNRSIKDDGQSQALTKEEIEKLRETSANTNDLVEQIVTNSKTFAFKTKYCQAKYLKKKEKKYFDYVQIRKPCIRLLTEMSHNWSQKSTIGLRSEQLAYILTAANIHSDGTYILHDGGTKGILTAAIMDRIGSKTNGRLIYLHPGNQCQRKAFDAMHFPTEQEERCFEANLYSVLRYHYQTNNKNGIEITSEPIDVDVKDGKRKAVDNAMEKEAKKSSWQKANETVCSILQDKKVNGAIIATRTFPDSLMQEIIQFIKPDGSLIIYNPYMHILTLIYGLLKKRTDIINIRVMSIHKTNIQVIPDVTHPEVNKTFGGYILSANKINAVV